MLHLREVVQEKNLPSIHPTASYLKASYPGADVELAKKEEI
jgi:hypothetical protein